MICRELLHTDFLDLSANADDVGTGVLQFHGKFRRVHHTATQHAALQIEYCKGGADAGVLDLESAVLNVEIEAGMRAKVESIRIFGTGRTRHSARRTRSFRGAGCNHARRTLHRRRAGLHNRRAGRHNAERTR